MSTQTPDKAPKRGAAPVVTLRRGPPPPDRIAPRSRSLGVRLVMFGAVALASYEIFSWIDTKLNCEPDPNNPDELICRHRNGSTYSRSRRWGWRSSSSSSSSWHGLSFGGFGHYGGG